MELILSLLIQITLNKLEPPALGTPGNPVYVPDEPIEV